MDARVLRLWHWNRAMAARDNANKHIARAEEWESKFKGKGLYNRHRAHEDNKMADFHIGCVQILNDHPDCIKAGTTAEDDAASIKLKRKIK